MYQNMPIMPLDFRSRNIHNKNNKIDQYNKQFMSLGYLGTRNREEFSQSGSSLITAQAHINNIKVDEQDYIIPIKKQLGDDLYNMMLNDERDITSGIDILYKHPRPKNIYNTMINNTYNINNVSDIEEYAVFHRGLITKPIIKTVQHKYIFTLNKEYSKYVDSNFINKVF